MIDAMRGGNPAQVQFGAEEASDEAGRRYSIRWAQDELGALQVKLPS